MRGLVVSRNGLQRLGRGRPDHWRVPLACHTRAWRAPVRLTATSSSSTPTAPAPPLDGSSRKSRRQGELAIEAVESAPVAPPYRRDDQLVSLRRLPIQAAAS